MAREDELREIREAKAAGTDTLNTLYNAQQLLKSAGNWGVFDMLGGGLLSNMMNHSKLSDANAQMEQAKYQIQIFQKELKDVDVPADFQVDISDFLVFADFFFDGIVADWMVQSKISDAKRQVEDAIQKINKIMADLDRWEAQII